MRTKARSILIGLLCTVVVLSMFGGITIADEKPAKIGIVLPFTGNTGWVGLSLPALKMAVEDVNAAGGAAGHPISLIVTDTETTTSGAVSGAKKVLGSGAIAIVGPTSLTIRSVMPIARDAGVVEISPTSGTTALDTQGGEYIFRTVSSDTVMGSGMVQKARELGAETAALFFNITEGAASVRGVIRKGCQVAGIDIVGEVEWTPGQASYRSELLSALKNSPDVVFFETGPKDGGVIFKQWRTLGVAPNATWIGTDYVNEPLLKASWPDSKGAFGVLAGPLLTDRFKAWKDRLEEYRGKKGIPTFSTNGWDAMNIIALAIEAAGEPTKEGIKANVRKVANPPGVKVTTFAEGKEELAKGNDIDYIGLAGAQDFNKYGDVITTLQVATFDNPDERSRITAYTQEDVGDIYKGVLELRKKEREEEEE